LHPAAPADRPLRLKRRGLTILACGLFLAAAWALSHAPDFVEHVYARRISFQIARALSLATGVVPIGLAEFALAGVVLYLIVPFVLAAVQVARRRRRLTNALAAGVLRVAVLAAVVASAFYLVWGLNYARAPLADRLGWPPIERPADEAAYRRHVEEIATLTKQLVDATNAAYREAMGGDDLGRQSELPGGRAVLDAALDAALPRVQQRLALEPAVAAARGRAKPVAASLLMNHLSLGGFYFPWTGEANYNRLQPAPTVPQAVAHEKAHQRGIALEDEANFIGYLACVMSDDPYARYSGYFFAQQQLLHELAARDLDRARALIGQRAAGVQRDADFIRAFWRQYEGTASRVSLAVNDRYLKSQGVRRGIASYAASRSLIVLFARHNHGDARIQRP
jgi:hypothetical protein